MEETYICCKCWNEFPLSEAWEGKLCPVCDHPMEQYCPKTPCSECLKKQDEQRYLMAGIMCEETPFIGANKNEQEENQ